MMTSWLSVLFNGFNMCNKNVQQKIKERFVKEEAKQEQEEEEIVVERRRAGYTGATCSSWKPLVRKRNQFHLKAL